MTGFTLQMQGETAPVLEQYHLLLIFKCFPNPIQKQLGIRCHSLVAFEFFPQIRHLYVNRTHVIFCLHAISTPFQDEQNNADYTFSILQMCPRTIKAPERTSSELQSRQLGDDLQRFHRHRDDLEDEIDDVAFVAILGEPLVRIVVDDAANSAPVLHRRCGTAASPSL